VLKKFDKYFRKESAKFAKSWNRANNNFCNEEYEHKPDNLRHERLHPNGTTGGQRDLNGHALQTGGRNVSDAGQDGFGWEQDAQSSVVCS